MSDEPNTTPTITPPQPASPASGPAPVTSDVAPSVGGSVPQTNPPPITDPLPAGLSPAPAAFDAVTSPPPSDPQPKTGNPKPFADTPVDPSPKTDPPPTVNEPPKIEPQAPTPAAASQPDLDALLNMDKSESHTVVSQPQEPPYIPPPTGVKTNKKGSKKPMILGIGLLLLLGIMSTTIFFLNQQKQIAEIRSKAADPCCGGNPVCMTWECQDAGVKNAWCQQRQGQPWCKPIDGRDVCGPCQGSTTPGPTSGGNNGTNTCDNSSDTHRLCRGQPFGTRIDSVPCTCTKTDGNKCACRPPGEDTGGPHCGPVCCQDVGGGYPEMKCDSGCGTGKGVACNSNGTGWQTTCVNAHACGYVYPTGGSDPECRVGTDDCQTKHGYGSGVTCQGGRCVGSSGRQFIGCGGPNNCYNCYSGASDPAKNGCFNEPYSCGAKSKCKGATPQPTSPPPTNPPVPTNTPTKNPTKTPTPTPKCGSACTTTTNGGSNCPTNLVCENSKCILPVCKTNPSSCDSTLCHVLPTPTKTPTPTTVPGQCQNIKIYKGGTLVTNLSTLQVNDAIVIAVVGSSTTQKAHVRVNGGTFTEITEKNSNNEYTYNFTIPTTGQFTVEAEVYIGGTWR